MIETTAIAVAVLFVGYFLIKRVKILNRFCIPAPVVGGLLFSVITLFGYITNLFSVNLDHTLQNIFMTAFFTSIGYSASIKSIKSGSRAITTLVIITIAIILIQDFIAFALAPAFKMHPLIALCTGSISMTGGVGTAIAWGGEIDKMGIAVNSTASDIAIAAATFGLVAGGLIGSPIGKQLIERYKLNSPLQQTENATDSAQTDFQTEKTSSITKNGLAYAIYQIIIAMGIGSLLSQILEGCGLLFPSYVGALIVAVILRNVGDFSGKYKINNFEINAVGQVCMSLFLVMALMSLKLWQLASLALPMIAMLCAQTLFMILFAYFVVFRALGKNYDAAIITAGVCGFGMGATPNAMANMESLTAKYRPSPKAFLIIPIVGGMFVDVFNSLFILIFINIF